MITFDPALPLEYMYFDVDTSTFYETESELSQHYRPMVKAGETITKRVMYSRSVPQVLVAYGRGEFSECVAMWKCRKATGMFQIMLDEYFGPLIAAEKAEAEQNEQLSNM